MSYPQLPLNARRRRLRIYFAAITVTVILLLGYAVADILLFYMRHRFAAQPLVDDARHRGPSIYEITPGGVRLRRFLDVEYWDAISGRTVAFRTNNLGYRGAYVGPKPSGEYRILVLGDSITLSAYTEEDETYPAILESLLNQGGMVAAPGGHAPSTGVAAGASAGRADERGETPSLPKSPGPQVPRSPAFRILNAGVEGIALREELHILTETGLLARPDLVLVGLFLNDAQRSHQVPLPQGLAASSEIARRVNELLLRQDITSEARKEYERLSGRPYPDQTYPDGAWRTDRAAFEAEIARWCYDWGRGFFPWAWETMRTDFEVLQHLAREHGFKLAVVLFPATIQWEAEFLDDRPQKMFTAMMTELAIPHLDLLPVLRADYTRQPRSLAYDHGHLRPEGNRIVAEAISAFLCERVLTSTATQASTAATPPPS